MWATFIYLHLCIHSSEVASTEICHCINNKPIIGWKAWRLWALFKLSRDEEIYLSLSWLTLRIEKNWLLRNLNKLRRGLINHRIVLNGFVRRANPCLHLLQGLLLRKLQRYEDNVGDEIFEKLRVVNFVRIPHMYTQTDIYLMSLQRTNRDVGLKHRCQKDFVKAFENIRSIFWLRCISDCGRRIHTSFDLLWEDAVKVEFSSFFVFIFPLFFGSNDWLKFSFFFLGFVFVSNCMCEC